MEEQQAAQKRPRLASADEAQPDESINNGHGLTEHSDKFVPMYGNYRGYYHKRTGASGLDQRLKLVPRELVKGKRVLDVGCNTGLVTIQIAQDMHPYRVTGVDLDEDLIEGAERQVEYAFARQAPVDEEQTVPPTANYFPASFARMFGLLPQPPPSYLVRYHQLSAEESAQATQRRGRRATRGQAPPREVRFFPRNLRLVHADWTKVEIDDDRKGYDLILAFSVIKWIHIHGTDQGLLDFFAKVFRSLRPSGVFIFEPQPWASYKKLKRLDPKLRENYDKLKMRPDGGFVEVLCEEIGFKSVVPLGVPPGPDAGRGFARQLWIATKPKGSWM